MAVVETKEYKEETKRKWGNTEAYKEHELKTKNYSHEKWNQLSDEMNSIFKEFANYLLKGENPKSNNVQNLVIKLQKFITDNYYTCSNEILYGLSQMYINDERFKENIDKNGDGTTKFINEAINIYCEK